MASVKDTDINSTGAIQLPAGTNADRPTSPNAGMLRWNTTYDLVEFYDGTAWINYNLGLTQGTAILDFASLPESFSGPAWVNPAKALGTGDRPILVQVQTDSNGAPHIKLRTTFTNGILSNSYSTTNCVDKVRSEGPNGGSSYAGQYFGLGNVDIAYAGNSGSGVGRSTTYVMNDTSDRRIEYITYYNFATGQNLTAQEYTDLAAWLNQTSPDSYQIALEVDDDNASFNSFGNNSIYAATSVSATQNCQNNAGAGHPVMIHNSGSTGQAWGDDGTTTGGMSTNNNTGGNYLLTRSRWVSNAVIATKHNSFTQEIYGQSGSALGANINKDFSQTETLPSNFVLPKAVSLMIHTGGGNAWAYMNNATTNNSNWENYFLVRAYEVL